MAAAIRSGEQGRGLAGIALTGLRSAAAEAGLARVIAPVGGARAVYHGADRDVHVTWTRPDGAPLDPWVRTPLSGSARPCWPRHRAARPASPGQSRTGELDRSGAAVIGPVRDPGRPQRA